MCLFLVSVVVVTNLLHENVQTGNIFLKIDLLGVLTQKKEIQRKFEISQNLTILRYYSEFERYPKQLRYGEFSPPAGSLDDI